MDVEALRRALEANGLKEGEYRLIFTKELRIEPIRKAYTIEQVFPYPLPEGKCEICGKQFKIHGYIPYFTDPNHIKAVRNFIIYLTEKLDSCKNMPLKLGVEAPNTVLNPKEIVTSIFELLKTSGDVNLANYMIRLVSHYTPSEAIRYSIEAGRGSLTQKLFQVERHYEALCREWRTEFQIHMEIDPKKDGKFDFYDFMQKHQLEVENDYFNIQSDFHMITARILAYEKLVKRFTELPRYGKLKQALRRKIEAPRPILFPTTYDLLSMSRRRRRPTV